MSDEKPRSAGDERARIVSWCRQWGPGDIMWQVADEIERGDHWSDIPPRPNKDDGPPARSAADERRDVLAYLRAIPGYLTRVCAADIERGDHERP